MTKVKDLTLADWKILQDWYFDKVINDIATKCQGDMRSAEVSLEQELVLFEDNPCKRILDLYFGVTEPKSDYVLKDGKKIPFELIDSYPYRRYVELRNSGKY